MNESNTAQEELLQLKTSYLSSLSSMFPKIQVYMFSDGYKKTRERYVAENTAQSVSIVTIDLSLRGQHDARERQAATLLPDTIDSSAALWEIEPDGT